MVSAAFLFVASYSASMLVLGARITVPIFVVHTVVIPLVFRFCKPFQRKLVFFNGWNWPPNPDFEQPIKSGIEATRNLYIKHQSKVDGTTVQIGIWHVLPASALDRLRTKLSDASDDETISALYDDELASSGRPVILYCHGNANSRAARHRIRLYEVLQALDVHVVAFDYRGYGDSSYVPPTEAGVVEDSLIVYDWLCNSIDKQKHSSPPIYLWGHSLGTGISSHLVGNLPELSVQYLERSESLPMPHGLILEAPFNNLHDEIANHPASKLVRWLPYYRVAFISPFTNSTEYEFRSDLHLSRVQSLPVLILHAKDDFIVPYDLGVKLWKSVEQSRGGAGAPVSLRSYDKRDRLGHKWICNATDLPQTIRDFMSGSLPENTQVQEVELL